MVMIQTGLCRSRKYRAWARGGDLMIGKAALGPAIETLLEHAARFILLLRLTGSGGAEKVRRDDGHNPRPSAPLTWDQATQKAWRQDFTTRTNLAVYLCEPVGSAIRAQT